MQPHVRYFPLFCTLSSFEGGTQIHKHASSCALAFGFFVCLPLLVLDFPGVGIPFISFVYIMIFTSGNGECEYKAAAFMSLSMISIAQLQFKNLWNHQDLWFVILFFQVINHDRHLQTLELHDFSLAFSQIKGQLTGKLRRGGAFNALFG